MTAITTPIAQRALSANPAPVVARRANRSSRRAFAGLRRRSGALAGAVLLHLAVVLAVGYSLDRAELHFAAVGGGGAILASLTPSSALTGAAARPPSDPLDNIVHTLGEAPSASIEPAPSTSKGSDLLAQLDQTLSPSHPAASRASAQAAPTRQTGPAANASTALDANDNPWSHASATALNTSKVHELWAAIQPCWRGQAGGGEASIRVVLGAGGAVVRMNALGQANGPARSAAEALAAAVSACAPYRSLGADAYLVTGPV